MFVNNNYRLLNFQETLVYHLKVSRLSTINSTTLTHLNAFCVFCVFVY